MSQFNDFTLTSIGIVHSCYREKFGIPKQPGLVTEATSKIELIPPFNRLDVLDGLEDFSHIWVQFIFHQALQEQWKAKVRPPRLGGKIKKGVFATRTTHRPNPLGLSVIKRGDIYKEKDKVFIDLIGGDLLDQTPIVDIKPYLPYADTIEDATSGFAPEATATFEVEFTPEALAQCNQFTMKYKRNLQILIQQVLGQDPRPSYLIHDRSRIHGLQLWDINIRWQAIDDFFLVLSITDIEKVDK